MYDLAAKPFITLELKGDIGVLATNLDTALVNLTQTCLRPADAPFGRREHFCIPSYSSWTP